MKYHHAGKVTWAGVTCDILCHSGQQCGHKAAPLRKTRSVPVNQTHVDLCNALLGMCWPPGGSTTGTLRYTSVTAVGFNTLLAMLPKMYNKISVTIDWLRKIGNNHLIRAIASKVHAVVIVDICASVTGYWSTSRLQKYIFAALRRCWKM